MLLLWLFHISILCSANFCFNASLILSVRYSLYLLQTQLIWSEFSISQFFFNMVFILKPKKCLEFFYDFFVMLTFSTSRVPWYISSTGFKIFCFKTELWKSIFFSSCDLKNSTFFTIFRKNKIQKMTKIHVAILCWTKIDDAMMR